MNKYRITNPYNNIVRDCKSRTTEAGISSGNLSFEEDAFAGFLGAVQNFYDKEPSASKVQVNQFMSMERRHSTSEKLRNSTMDIAYYFNNGRTGARTTDKNVSKGLNQSLLNSFKRFGLAAKGSSFTSTQANNKVNFLEGTTGAKDHHHHIHIGGFSKNISRLLSPIEIIDKK
ncbi:MAG: hypothetical protein VB048_11730 [Bacteroidaceae bacterium]|nr:hypothetical protein [Bacteroidaceae bacterium]MEA5098947.1 hypothetical protein [Bacteroidales bacterium]